MQDGLVQTWHDGLPSELPETLALPERPRMRMRRPDAGEAMIAVSNGTASIPARSAAIDTDFAMR